MLYLVGGAGRSGKSLLAGRMLARHGIPWFPLDALKMGLAHGAPATGVDPDHHDLDTADRMWPVVEPMLRNLLFDSRDYLVEGAHFRPHTVRDFVATIGRPVRACFLGYPEIDLETKAAAVRDHLGPPANWLRGADPDRVRSYLLLGRTISRETRSDCAALGLPFFDTGADFEAALAAAEARLLAPPPAG